MLENGKVNAQRFGPPSVQSGWRRPMLQFTEKRIGLALTQKARWRIIFLQWPMTKCFSLSHFYNRLRFGLDFAFRGLRMVVGAKLKRPVVGLERKGKFPIQMHGPMNMNVQTVVLDESTVELPLGDSSSR